MKLSKAQSDAIFNLIREELNSMEKVAQREILLGNKKREQEAVTEFKKTKEYDAVMLLGKTFKGRQIDWSKKEHIEQLAIFMFKPERKSGFYTISKERETIELLAIDCKTLVELKEKINVHYKLKNKLK
jgi:hypothetical protein